MEKDRQVKKHLTELTQDAPVSKPYKQVFKHFEDEFEDPTENPSEEVTEHPRDLVEHSTENDEEHNPVFKISQTMKIDLAPFDIETCCQVQSDTHHLQSCLKVNGKAVIYNKKLRFSSTVYVRFYLSAPFRENRGLSRIISNMKGKLPRFRISPHKGGNNQQTRARRAEQTYIPSRMSALKRRLATLKARRSSKSA